MVVAIGRYRAYRVKFASGSVLWRNRRFLRRLVNTGGSEGDDDGAQDQACDNGCNGRDGASHTTKESGDDETAVHVDDKSAAPRVNPPAQRRSDPESYCVYVSYAHRICVKLCVLEFTCIPLLVSCVFSPFPFWESGHGILVGRPVYLYAFDFATIICVYKLSRPTWVKLFTA